MHNAEKIVTKTRRLVSKPLTKPGKHGTLYHFVLTYGDDIDPSFGPMTWKTWAYDSEHALDKFYDSNDGDSFRVQKWRRETDAPVQPPNRTLYVAAGHEARVSLFKPGKPVLPPGTRGGRQRLSVDGWHVTYYEPTYGSRNFTVTTHDELAKTKQWLNEGGYSYKVREIR